MPQPVQFDRETMDVDRCNGKPSIIVNSCTMCGALINGQMRLNLEAHITWHAQLQAWADGRSIETGRHRIPDFH